MKKTIALCFVVLCAFFSAAAAAETPPATEVKIDVNAKSALLMEASSGEVLFERNPHEPLSPASVTKIMTMLLTMEAIERGQIGYDTIVVASERAKSMGGSTIFLDTNEEMSVNDLLKGIAVASGNDACVAIGEHIAGSEAAFVDQMNARAQELGMKDTQFMNTNGLDADGHHTSAYDVAIMSRELLKHTDIFRYTTIWMDELRGGKFQLANTNKLIRFYQGANGLKTGSTDKALYCVSATAKRDDMQLIAVVLGSPSSAIRFSSARHMLDYGFANYAVTGGGEKGKEVAEVAVGKGKNQNVMAVVKDGYNALILKARKNEVKTEILLPQSVNAPIAEGQVLGEMVFTLDGKELGRSALAAKNAVGKLSPLGFLYKMMRGFTANR